MPTIVSHLLLKKLAHFPSYTEAMRYARQRLAEGCQRVNITPAGGGFDVCEPRRFIL